MKSWASASSAAFSTSASLASDRPMRMFSAMERLKRPASWNTTAMLPRSEPSVTSATSWPSTRMRPWSGERSRCSRASVVVLPAPVGPTSATVSPAAASRLMSNTPCSLFLKRNVTSS